MLNNPYLSLQTSSCRQADDPWALLADNGEAKAKDREREKREVRHRLLHHSHLKLAASLD